MLFCGDRRGQETRPIADHLQQRPGRHQLVVAAFKMRPGAAVGIAVRLADDLRPHGVQLDVSCGGQQVLVVHHKRSKTALPKMPSPALAKVDPPRVSPMGLADRPTQPVLVLGHGDQVNVVGHQAVSPDGHSALFTPLRHQIDVRLIVLLREERLLPPIPPLRHVMRVAGNNNSCQSSHAISLAETAR